MSARRVHFGPRAARLAVLGGALLGSCAAVAPAASVPPVAAGAGAGADPAAAATATAPDAPPSDRLTLGLYVGIGDYEDFEVTPLTLQRTNRDVLLPLLADRFGVRWDGVVMDADATRAGIGAAMLDLVASAREATAAGRSVTVVFLYTGHGSQVKDQDGDEPDGLDETLVTVRSSIAEGIEDIRDDDLAAWRAALADAGAELVMIVEACHSETTFRGPVALSLPRLVGPGPREPLLPRLAEFYAAPNAAAVGLTGAKLLDGGGGGGGRSGGDDGFVCLSAVQDEFPALTTQEDGRQWGRFSRSLVAALESLPPGASYRTLHAQLAREFDQRFPGGRQRPTLHPRSAAGGAIDRPFLGGRHRSPHARVVIAADDRTATLDAGAGRGYSAGSRVAIFASVDALEAWEREAPGHAPITEALITDASFDEAALGLSATDRASIPESAVARIVVPAIPPVATFIASDIAPALRTRILETVASGRRNASVQFTDSFAEADLVVAALDGGGIGVFDVSEAASPGANAATAEPGIPLRTLDPDRASADAIVDELDFVVRTRRFWTLSGLPGEVEFRIERPDGSPLPVNAAGIPSVTSGQEVRIRVANRTDRDRRIHLLQSAEIDGVLGPFGQATLRPEPGTAREVFRPDETLEFAGPGVTLTIDAPAGATPGRRSLLRIKLVAIDAGDGTGGDLDLAASLSEPRGRRRSRSAEAGDPFTQMFERAMLRPRSGLRSPLAWATADLVIEITAAGDAAAPAP